MIVKKKDDFQDIESMTIRLSKAASITDSEGEKSFPAFLKAVLLEIPYFQTNPDDIVIQNIENDPKGRANLFALVRGSGKDCVLLTGHYDVVQTSMYGSLEPWAFDPEALKAKLLDQPPELDGTEEALQSLRKDLASGEFLPGRGVLDMKSGLAAGISILSAFSRKREHGGGNDGVHRTDHSEELWHEHGGGRREERQPDQIGELGDNNAGKRRGNILFMAVADEEGSSRGMKAAASRLPVLLKDWGLEPRLVVNLDAAVDQGEGEQGRAVFTGSVGKALPFVYFIGRCTHAGAPFDGINPALMASEFAREIECNPDALAERRDKPGEAPSPPTILYFREARESYDVTTAQAFFCAINVLSHTLSPEAIIESLGKLAETAMYRATELLGKRASAFSGLVSGQFSIPDVKPSVLAFKDFVRKAELAKPGILDSARSLAATRHPDDRVQQSLAVLQTILPFAGIEGPAAVLGFAPPYYPRAEFDQNKNADFMATLREIIADFSKEIGKRIRLRPYFPGISDMSFLSFFDSPEQRCFVRKMCPVIDSFGADAALLPIGCPVINLGPWGREYHQLGERVHKEYSFKQMPILLSRLVSAVLNREE